MKIKSKLTIVGLIPLFLAVVAILVVYWTNEATNRSRTMESNAYEITRNVFELNLAIDQFLLYPEERPRVQFQSLHESLKKKFALFMARTEEERSILNSMRQNHEAMGELFSMLAQLREKQGFGNEGANSTELRERIIGQLLANSRDIATDALGLSRISAAQLDAVRQWRNYSIFVAVLIFGMVTVGFVYLIGKSILKPIRMLQKETEAISKGNLNHPIVMESMDEVGQLSKAFKEMTSRLKTSYASIDDLKTAEKSLRESEERYRNLIQHSPAGIYEIDFTSGRFTQVNDAMCQILGYTEDELLRMTASDILDDEGEALFASRIRLAQSGTAPEGVAEYKVWTKDGRLLWSLLNITFKWDGNKITGASVVAHDITERRQAEEALRESQTLLNAVMENTPDPVYVKDDQSRIIMANPALAKVVGKPLGEILGRTDSEYYGDADTGNALREHDLRVMKSGQSEVTEETVPTPEGHRTFLSSKTPYRNASGDTIGITGISRDITERKRVEETLRESELRLRLAQEHGHVGVWDWYPEKGEENFSREMNRIYGIPPGRIQTYEDWLKRVHPEDVERMIAERDAAIAKHESFDLEFRVFHGSGDIRWICSRGGAEYDETGQPTRVFGINIDITDRKQAEEALQQRTLELQHLSETLEQRVKERTADVERERRQLYEVLEAIPAMVSLLTPDYHVSFANRSFREKFGESNGRHCYEFCFGQPRPCEFCETYEVLKTGKPHYWEVTTPDGNTIFDAHDFPFTDVDGSPLILEMDIDVTDWRRAENALKEKAKELADLSSQLVTAQENERRRVSYDLHDNVWQMLLAIRFGIENLFSGRDRNWTTLKKKANEVMMNIMEAVGKIRSMQGDLWPYVLDDIGVLATINWYCREFEKDHSGLSIENHVDLGEHEVPQSTKIVIYRILQETLDNVAKHSRASRATVRLKKRDHGIEFTVEDNGIGFDPKETIAKNVPWGGLGLLNIKARTELSGGTFGIESAEGKGTTVKAMWPL